ncbi:MAG TPA: hypothetical protein VH306_03690 [Gaiellaceae bacterium]|jgi:hypothetical protein
MPTIEVRPRPTPEERSEVSVDVEVDEDLAVFASVIEDWTTPRQDWDYALREGTDFGKPNNVEVRLVYAAGEHTSALSFRLDQVAQVDDTGEELVLVLEERDGIAKLARLGSNVLELELFHILTYT